MGLHEFSTVYEGRNVIKKVEFISRPNRSITLYSALLTIKQQFTINNCAK